MDVILNGLSLLHEPDEIIEIRSIDPKPVISGYFRADSPAIAKSSPGIRTAPSTRR